MELGCAQFLEEMQGGGNLLREPRACGLRPSRRLQPLMLGLGIPGRDQLAKALGTDRSIEEMLDQNPGLDLGVHEAPPRRSLQQPRVASARTRSDAGPGD